MLSNDTKKNIAKRHNLKPLPQEPSVAEGFNFPSTADLVLSTLLTKGDLYYLFLLA